ncbi:MAG TPA: OmpA family protein [Acidisoma sp.]|uniref:OmpA family protein n=1 Tax=Acidisoma sp. TaxID=1872115 RepID=UPI002CAE1464|nr:OmpA family protein [Acidisoma sp.]HTI00217.1 OmpA family protein [Acidisoma sp.]
MSSGGEDGEKPPNHERWVISYADFMTLLFALFVVLFASSSRNRAKMEEEAKGMVAAFHGLTPALIRQQGASKGMMKHQPSPVPKPIENPAPRTPHNEAKPKQSAPVNLPVPPKPHAPAIAPKPAQPMPPPTPVPQRPVLSKAVSQQLAQEALALEKVKQQLESLLSPLTSGHQVTIEATPLTLTISLDAAVLFDSGKAELLPGAKSLLDNVADSLKSLPRPFAINLQGYTDNQPIATPQYPSNWSLSAERAVSVVELFGQQGIEGDRLSAQGFGEYVPLADNSTEQGRAKNRRVVIVIRAPDVQAPSPSTTTAPESEPIAPASLNVTLPQPAPPSRAAVASPSPPSPASPHPSP